MKNQSFSPGIYAGLFFCIFLVLFGCKKNNHVESSIFSEPGMVEQIKTEFTRQQIDTFLTQRLKNDIFITWVPQWKRTEIKSTAQSQGNIYIPLVAETKNFNTKETNPVNTVGIQKYLLVKQSSTGFEF